MESPVFGFLVIIAFGLLVALSGGILYLTVVEWRDRRRRNSEVRENTAARRRAK